MPPAETDAHARPPGRPHPLFLLVVAGLTASSERPAAATILVGVDLGLPHFDAELEELGQLAQTAGMEPVARVACKRKAPDAALFIGRGKADVF